MSGVSSRIDDSSGKVNKFESKGQLIDQQNGCFIVGKRVILLDAEGSIAITHFSSASRC